MNAPARSKSWRRPEVVKACRQRKKARASAFVSSIRQMTFCQRCGAQPIEWHNQEHEGNPQRRIANMVGQGNTPIRILAEIEKCTALCRRCHMAIDGRTKKLVAAGGWRAKPRPRVQGRFASEVGA